MKTTEQMIAELKERISEDTINKVKDDPAKVASLHKCLIGEPAPVSAPSNDLTREQADDLAARARKAGAQVSVRRSEYSDSLEVTVRMSDAATGNGETRTLTDADADVESICREMKAALKQAANRTRKAIATEKAMDAE